MPVRVDIEKCDACLKCAKVCPNRTIDKANDGTKDHARVSEEDCLDCYLCVSECPTGAMQEP
jgi:NAD-dependent dihydropyrimidine dehydrogenase PreA subunit